MNDAQTVKKRGQFWPVALWVSCVAAGTGAISAQPAELYRNPAKAEPVSVHAVLRVGPAGATERAGPPALGRGRQLGEPLAPYYLSEREFTPDIVEQPPPALGPCCLQLGSRICRELTADDCNRLGGVFLGPGVTCNSAACDPTRFGGCCYQSPNPAVGRFCQLMTPDACASVAGVYFGDGAPCLANACSAPATGACCLSGPERFCIDVTAATCAIDGGQYLGDNARCTSTACVPDLPGACCLPANSPGGAATCEFLSESGCALQSGQFAGHGTSCGGSACGPPQTGACCLGSGGALVCAIRTPAQCLSGGGAYLGDQVTCSPSPCAPAPPLGACCLPDVGPRCLETTVADCYAAGGSFYGGSNSTCAAGACGTRPLGACCLPVRNARGVSMASMCAQVSEPDCIAVGGLYQGDGVFCPNLGPAAQESCFGTPQFMIRPGDMNLDGFVNGFDIDIFVEALVDEAHFAEHYPTTARQIADVNRDGNVDYFDVDPFVVLLVGP